MFDRGTRPQDRGRLPLKAAPKVSHTISVALKRSQKITGIKHGTGAGGLKRSTVSLHS